MKVRIGDRNADALRYICRNLRERDRAELFATRFDDDPDALAADTFLAGDFQWVAYVEDTPVAVIGAAPLWPNVWALFAFGTDRWPEVVLSLTRHIKNFMIPGLFHAGAIRGQCHALFAHDDARRWLTALGATEEHVLENFGKSGERFVLYSWGREDAQRMMETSHVRKTKGQQRDALSAAGGSG